MYLAQQSEINLQVPGGSGFENLSSFSMATLISYAIQLILVVTAVILFFILILGGIAVIISGGGDSQGATRGRQAVSAAIIGLVIVFGAWAIIQLIEVFFGVTILSGLDINP
jgi:hypothetical protein